MPLTINRELTNESTVNCGAFRYTQDAADVVRLNHTGWYTNPFGEAFKDGSGLCHGVVARLAGGGPARFAVGYRMGDHDDDDAGTFSMRGLYVAESSDESDIEQAGQDAARVANELACMLNVRFIAGRGDVMCLHGKRARVIIIIMVTHAIARNKSGRATAC